MSVIAAYQAQVMLMAQQQGTLNHPEVKAYLAQLQQMQAAAQHSLLMNMNGDINSSLSGPLSGLFQNQNATSLQGIPGLVSQNPSLQDLAQMGLPQLSMEHKAILEKETEHWHILASMSSSARAREIRDIDDLGTKTRMVIHWLFSKIPHDELMDLYSIIVHCFTSFISGGFQNIDIKEEEHSKVDRFKEVNLLKYAVKDNLKKFRTSAHVEMLRLLTNDKHPFLPRLLKCEYSLENLAMLQAWIQKGFRAVEAAFMYELFYEPNFDKSFPPNCQRRQQLDETVITHLNRFFTDHIKRLETDITGRRPHLAGLKLMPISKKGSMGRGITPLKKAITIEDSVKFLNSNDFEIQKGGLKQLKEAISTEQTRPIRDLQLLLEPVNLNQLMQMCPSTQPIATNLQELMTPELRLDALRILTSLCGIISYESQIQTLINLGVIRRFVELLSHSNNVIVYMSLVGITNAGFVSNNVLRRIIQDGFLIDLHQTMMKKIESLEGMSNSPNPKETLGIQAVLKQISWIILNLSRTLLSKTDPNRFNLREIETSLPIIKELLMVDDSQVVVDCTQALHGLIETNVPTYTNMNIPVVMNTIPVIAVLAVLKKSWCRARLNVLSFIWKIIKNDEFHRKMFLDHDLISAMHLMVSESEDTHLDRTCVRAVSYILLFLCGNNLPQPHVRPTMETLVLMLRSPDTETAQNTIVALDIIVSGQSPTEDVFAQKVGDPDKDSKIEFLIDKQPCDQFLKQTTCDNWEVQRASVRLMDELVSYARKKWISLKWVLNSGLLSRIRVLLAHPNKTCREIALHVVVKLVERGRKTPLVDMFMENRIFETVMSLRYLQPEFVHPKADFVIEEGFNHTDPEKVKALRRKQLELVRIADNSVISAKTLSVLVAGITGQMDSAEEVRRTCATKLKEFMDPTHPDISKRADLVISNNLIPLLLKVGREGCSPELLEPVMHCICCATLGSKPNILRLVELDIISFFREHLQAAATSNSIPQIFWAISNVCAAVDRTKRADLVSGLHVPVLTILKNFAGSTEPGDIQSLLGAVGLLRLVVAFIDLDHCGAVVIHCFDVLDTPDPTVVAHTLELLYGILLQVRDRLGDSETSEPVPLGILSTLAYRKFPDRIKRLMRNKEYDVRTTALRICIPLVECVRVRPDSTHAVTLAKQTVDKIDADTLQLLSEMITSAKNSDRIFAISYLYGIVNIHEWPNSEPPSAFKDFNLFKAYPDMCEWFASSQIMFPLLGILVIARNKSLKDMIRVIFTKVLESATGPQIRKLRMSSNIDKVFGAFQDSEATLMANDELFVSSRHRILIYNDLYFIFTSWVMNKLHAKCPGLTSCTFQPLQDIMMEFKQENVLTALLNMQKNKTRVFSQMKIHNLEVFKYDTKYDRIVWPFPGTSLETYRSDNVAKLVDQFLDQCVHIIAPGGQVVIIFVSEDEREKVELDYRANKKSWILKQRGFRPDFFESYEPLDLAGRPFATDACVVSVLQRSE